MALKVLLGSCPPKQESTSHRAAPSPGWDTASPLQDQVHLLRVCRQCKLSAAVGTPEAWETIQRDLNEL